MKNLELTDNLTKEQIKNIKYAVKNNLPIIVGGDESCPTGKTTLYQLLKSQGILVYENYQVVKIELNNRIRRD